MVSNKINLFIVVGFALVFMALSAKNAIAKETTKKIYSQNLNEKNTKNFHRVKLFGYERNVTENDNSAAIVRNGTILNLQTQSLRQTLTGQHEAILFNIPVNKNNSLELELTQTFPLSDDFVLIRKDINSEKTEYYKGGLHYSGKIKGDDKSIAVISIFENFVMGIVSNREGNYVLGSIKNSDNSYSNKYIFYNDRDLVAPNNFRCDVDKYEDKLTQSINSAIDKSNEYHLTDDPSALPVKVYFEADYKMYQDFNNNNNEVVNFISGMFNAVKTIYQNENIPFVISSIGIWNVPDPYLNFNDSYPILLNFGARSKDNFQGNIGHLLSSRTGGLGGIAWVRMLCSQYNPQDSSGRYAFSNVETNYNSYPAYSWTVNVVTHEMGHTLGSRHTHSCVWPVGPQGAIRAIDSCYNAEGNCFQQLRPRVGTIMSYCHLWTQQQGGGVNLSLGFGPLPGDTIRSGYTQAACLRVGLNSSEVPSSFSLAQNFPNPFNPVTMIRFALPSESVVSLRIYDVAGRIVASLVQEKFYNPGFYDLQFNSSQYSLSSGIYFYKLEVKSPAGGGQSFVEAKRMVLIK